MKIQGIIMRETQQEGKHLTLPVFYFENFFSNCFVIQVCQDSISK